MEKQPIPTASAAPEPVTNILVKTTNIKPVDNQDGTYGIYVEPFIIEPGEVRRVQTGIHLAIPIRMAAQIGCGRAYYEKDIKAKNISAHTIDTHELMVIVKNVSKNIVKVCATDEIAKLYFTPVIPVALVDKLPAIQPIYTTFSNLKDWFVTNFINNKHFMLERFRNDVYNDHIARLVNPSDSVAGNILYQSLSAEILQALQEEFEKLK